MQTILLNSLSSTGRFLLNVVPFFVLGVVLAQLFIELRWLEKLSWLARPLAKFGHLQPECGSSFLVALISPTAGYSMLAKYHDEGRIRRSELIISAILNGLPGYISQGRTVLPVTLPLLGAFGFLYYSLVVLADILKAAIALSVGNLILPRRDIAQLAPAGTSHTPRPQFRTALLNSLRRSRKTILKVLATMIPVTFLVFLLIQIGTFEAIAKKIGIVARVFPVSADALPVVATRLASPVGAYTMAGNLMSKGILAGKEIVIALLVGSLLATVPNMRYIIPYYFGIFGPRIGTQLILASTLLRILAFASIILAVSFLYL